MSLKKIQEEYRSTPRREVFEGAFENFLYGLLGAILVVFIAEQIDVAVLVAYMVYYFYVGKVVNRPKYVTSLGKFIVFPVPAALGAFTGYKIAQYLSVIL